MGPAWVVDDLAAVLEPPAIVCKLGEVRSAANTLEITRALLGLVKPALFMVPARLIPQRYRPETVGTKCNFFVSDTGQIHLAPLPHRWRITPGGALQWMSANDMVVALRAGLYPGWSPVQVAKLGELNVVERAALGLPTVAVWHNPTRDPVGAPNPGHVVWVVETPPGKTGIYVTGAGRNCVDQCPIEMAFGPFVKQVEFYGHP